MHRLLWLSAAFGIALVSCTSKPIASNTPEEPAAPAAMPEKPAPANPPVLQPKTPAPDKETKPKNELTVEQIQQAKVRAMKQLFKTNPPGQGGWRKSTVPAMALVKQVDAKLANLSDASWDYKVFAEMPDGRSQSQGSGHVVSPKRFRYEYVSFGSTRTTYVNRNTCIADGSRVSLISAKGVSDPKPVGLKNRMETKDLVGEWPVRFSELIFSGIGSKQRPFTAYLTAVSKPGSGFTVTAEDRSALVGSKRFNNERILVTRKNPPYNVEMIFDSNYMIPVSARLSTTPLPGKTRSQNWSAAWNLNKGQQFDPKLFVIPEGPF